MNSLMIPLNTEDRHTRVPGIQPDDDSAFKVWFHIGNSQLVPPMINNIMYHAEVTPNRRPEI